ncbi:Oxidoreductase-like domain-containing protein 1 [Mactra antiquata]
MALQSWTSKLTKVLIPKKHYWLPYRLDIHTSKSLTMLFRDLCACCTEKLSNYNVNFTLNQQALKWQQTCLHTCACNFDDSVLGQKPNELHVNNGTDTTEPLKNARVLISETKSSNEIDSDLEDVYIKPSLDSIRPSVPPPLHVDIVPGKGPPPEPPVDCCMSGCANCVWIQYAEELKQYFSKDAGLERVKEDIEKIDNPGLKMFLKLELGLL